MLEAFNGEASVLRVRAAEFRTISERSQLDLWQGWLRQTEWRLAVKLERMTDASTTDA